MGLRSKRHHFASSSSSSSSSSSVSCRAAKKVHTVQKGEWLSSIAPQYGVTTEQLAKENKALIGAGDMIFPGDQLKIPTVGGSGIKGVLVKITVALLIVAAASGIWPTIKEQMDEK